jgi:hypothetical protein
LFSRALRLTCGLLAFLAFGAAAFLLNSSNQHIDQQAASLRAFDQHARDASDALVDARVSQQAYVAAGQGIPFWTGKSFTAVQSATTALTALHESAGAGARTALDEASATVVEFAAIDKRVRDYLKSGQQLMAGDVIFTEGSDAAATAVRQIETARLAEHQASEAQVTGIRKQQMLTAAGVAGLVGVIVLLLIPVPRRAATEAPAVATTSIAPIAPAVVEVTVVEPVVAPAVVPAVVPVPLAPAPARAAGSMFKAATDVVTDFGRVRDLDELARVLGRAADVMDASGLMVWAGSVEGGDLRPVLAHGYSPEMIARIPPVARSADNAAAAAYRSGTLQIVASRPGGSSGAVVAPILSADGCIGALSAEIRSGGETSDTVQALAIIFAAHLAGVIGTSPAGDVTEPKTAANS